MVKRMADNKMKTLETEEIRYFLIKEGISPPKIPYIFSGISSKSKCVSRIQKSIKNLKHFFSQKQIVHMVEICPRILNQEIDTINQIYNYFKDDLDIPDPSKILIQNVGILLRNKNSINEKINKLKDVLQIDSIIEIIKLCPRILTNSVNTTKRRYDHLKNNLKIKEIKKTIIRQPQILTTKIDTIDLKIMYLNELIPLKRIQVNTCAYPRVLTMALTTMQKRVEFLKQNFPNCEISKVLNYSLAFFGVSVNKIEERIENLSIVIPKEHIYLFDYYSFKLLLASSSKVNEIVEMLENRLRIINPGNALINNSGLVSNNANLIYENGLFIKKRLKFDSKAFNQMVNRNYKFLTLSKSTIEKRINYLESLGFSIERLLLYEPALLIYSKEAIDLRVDYLCRYKWDYLEMTNKYPGLMTLDPLENIDPKIIYFKFKLDISIEQIEEKPSTLGNSLTRIKECIKIFEEMKVDITLFSFAEKLHLILKGKPEIIKKNGDLLKKIGKFDKIFEDLRLLMASPDRLKREFQSYQKGYFKLKYSKLVERFKKCIEKYELRIEKIQDLCLNYEKIFHLKTKINYTGIFAGCIFYLIELKNEKDVTYLNLSKSIGMELKLINFYHQNIKKIDKKSLNSRYASDLKEILIDLMDISKNIRLDFPSSHIDMELLLSRIINGDIIDVQKLVQPIFQDWDDILGLIPNSVYEELDVIKAMFSEILAEYQDSNSIQDNNDFFQNSILFLNQFLRGFVSIRNEINEINEIVHEFDINTNFNKTNFKSILGGATYYYYQMNRTKPTYSMVKIGELFGISENAIKNSYAFLLKSRGLKLPTKLDELIDYYRNKWNLGTSDKEVFEICSTCIAMNQKQRFSKRSLIGAANFYLLSKKENYYQSMTNFCNSYEITRNSMADYLRLIKKKDQNNV